MLIIFFLIALAYAMVGFGGGSSYLAVLVLAGVPYQHIAPVALCCNLVVTTGGLWHFARAGHLKLKTVLPFAIASIPMAYVGGRLAISYDLFSILLGLSLLLVAVRMFLPARSCDSIREISVVKSLCVGLPLGAALGFLAGLIGIGGGIFLAPVLLLLRWANIKEAAAAASVFIVMNSAAGLLGQLQKGAFDFNLLYPLALAVFLGGQIGSRLGAYKLPKIRLQQLLAVLVLYVSVKLLWGVI